MPDAIERLLELVASGRLTPAEAGPLLDALSRSARGRADGMVDRASSGGGSGAAPAGTTLPRFARIEVRDGGKRVVDLRIPVSLGRTALARVPGLTVDHLADLDAAIAAGTHGPILDVESPDGDGVRIVLE